MKTGKRAGAIVRAATVGAITPIAFTLGVVVAALQFDGYSHVTQKISELGGPEAATAWIQNINFVVLGGLTLALAWALAQVPGPSRLGAVLLGYFGVVAIVHAFLTCDVGCAGSTTTGLLHNVTGLSAFLATIAAMFVFERSWRDDPRWRDHARFTRIIRVIAVLGLVWFVVTQAAELESAAAGIAQRTFAGALVLWIGVTGWRLRSIILDQSIGGVSPADAVEQAPVASR